ncbi:MAG TPA: hypothetical protein VFV34_05885 [Blastocatellia bacterium]|nr:hypothetical protein [Blastocatellia bacterium]
MNEQSVHLSAEDLARYRRREMAASQLIAADDHLAAHSPSVLDTDIDRFESAKIWIRDAQRRKFVSVAKGQSALVEVESREFPWFCRGDAGPNEPESAAGPVGTYLRRVTRAATGDRIDWKFLSWH